MEGSNYKTSIGFTLIELMAVLIMIGVLVLLAMPNYINQSNEADVSLIRNDIMLVESVVKENLFLEPDSFSEYQSELLDNMSTFIEDDILYDSEGKTSIIEGTSFKYIPNELIEDKTPIKPEGAFLTNEDGKVYYVWE